MGILRGKNSERESSNSLDPFEGLEDSFAEKNLFADLSQTARQVDGLNIGVASHKSEGLGVSGPKNESVKKIIMAAALLGLAGFAVARLKPWSYFESQQLVYAYFEVRALDASGRPIAGAVVKNGGKRVGTTDSFGEWRRYMRVPLGATVPVTIAKKSSNQVLFATKNFAVPPGKPDKSEIELRGSVQLQAADVNDLNVKSAASVSPNDLVQATVSNKSGNKDALSKDPPAMTAVEDSSVSDSAKKETAQINKAPIAAANVPAFVSSHESIAFEASGSQSSPLQKEILPALKQRATELGLRVDPNAAWKVRLTSLIEKPARVTKDGGGLIMISSFDGENGGNVREFLRNYQQDATGTARGILYILSHHVDKNVAVRRAGDRWVAMLPSSSSDLWKLSSGRSLAGISGTFVLGGEEYKDDKHAGYYMQNAAQPPCVKDVNGCELKTRSFADVAPVPNWSRLRLKSPALGKEPVKIFVAGYEAKLVGDKLYEYWGQDKARANVTVVQAGKVLYRGQVLGNASQPANLPIANISRR